MHTHAGLAQLASARRPGEARRRGEEERGEASERAPTAAARDFLPVLREEPASKDRTKAIAAAMSLALPVSRGEVVHVPDAVPAMSLTPFVRWAYSAGEFFLNILTDAAETKVCCKEAYSWQKCAASGCECKGRNGPESSQKAGSKLNPQLLVLVNVDLPPRGAGPSVV